MNGHSIVVSSTLVVARNFIVAAVVVQAVTSRHKETLLVPDAKVNSPSRHRDDTPMVSPNLESLDVVVFPFPLQFPFPNG